MNNQFEWQETVALEDCDLFGRMTPEALMRRMQRSTGHYADLRGVGVGALSLGKWMIVHALMQAERMPKLGEQLRYVFSMGTPVILFPCFLSVYDEQGRMIVGIYSEWCVLCHTQNGLVRPSDLGFGAGEQYVTPFQPPRALDDATLPSAERLVYEKKIRLSDLDLNRHTNNLRYVAMVTDMFSVSEWEGRSLCGMELRFLGQSFEGDTLRFLRRDGDGISLLRAVDPNDKEIFRAVMAFEARKEG